MSLRKPYWTSRSGNTLDTTTMTRIALQRVRELEPYVASLSDELVKAEARVKELKEETVHANQQLAYWGAMQEIAKEIDQRLELELEQEGEDGNATEMG